MRVGLGSIVLLGMFLVGCTGRSVEDGADGAEDGEGDVTGDPADSPEELVGCDVVEEIAVGTPWISGEVTASGRSTGVCGAEGFDATYVVRPDEDVDVLVRVIESDFAATIRVEEDGCGAQASMTRACGGQASHAFLARAGHDTYITIDSPDDAAGGFELELQWGDLPISACEISPGVAWAGPGGGFGMGGSLGAGFGSIDSRCGAPGTEQMWRLSVESPVHISGSARVGDGPAVLNVRDGCGATREIDCTVGPAGGPAVLELDLQPGEYWVIIDQARTAGGEFQLELEFS